MIFTINRITHEPGKTHCVQGVKKHEVPKLARKKHILSGGFGSYRVKDPSKTFVSFKDENGKNYRIDVFSPLKEATDGRRFTEKYMQTLNSKIENVEFEVAEGDNLKDCLMQELKKHLI